jgi:hypothetical protein
MIHKADVKADQAIDDNTYDHAQTVTIKVPLSLPYPIQNAFERIKGDFEYQGEFYKLVEQKYENDTVFVVCLKNSEKKQALAVLNDIVKQSTDQSSTNSNSTSKGLVGFLKDYNPVTEEIVVQSPFLLENAVPSAGNADELLCRDLSVPTPPPNEIC